MTADEFSNVVRDLLMDRKAEGGSRHEALSSFLEVCFEVYREGPRARSECESNPRKEDVLEKKPMTPEEAAAEMMLSVLAALDVPTSAHTKVLRYAGERIAEKAYAVSQEDRTFAEARRRSRDAVRAFFREQGELLTTWVFAQRLGCSVRELEHRHARNEFLALERKGQIVWPGWQLHKGSPLPGFAEVAAKLSYRGFAPSSIATFFLCPSDCLYLSSANPRRDGVRRSDSPLSLLRRRGLAALDLVLMHAERFGEQGAV